MNRPSVVYVIMLAAGVLGIWAILDAKHRVQAPPELSGNWELRTDRVADDGSPIPPIRLSIRQSGQYLQIAIGNRASQDFKLAALPSATDDETLFAVRGDTESYIIAIPREGDDVRFEGFQSIEGGPKSRIGRRVVGRTAAAETSVAKTEVVERKSKHHFILLLILQITLILIVSQLMGRAFEYIHQPRVMGEMVAGIMLGPSLLGWAFPEMWSELFTPDTTPYLNVLSQLGVIFFLFLIGLELDPKLLRDRGHTAVVVSHASIVAPFLLGGLLTVYLFPILFNDTPTMRFSSVALFMGAAMSITAFPVLARILTERNLHKTPVGAIAITCAAVDDVTAWCMLAFVVGFARAEGMGPAVLTAGLSTIYVLTMFFAVRPLLVRLERMFERQGRVSRGVVGVIFVLVLASAGVTEAIGIHALFGAFLMGAIMPKNSRFVVELNDKIEDFVVVALLPIFFAYTGLHTRIGLLNSTELWTLTLLIIFVACAGKFGGSTIAAKACGMTWRESSAIGILMNTRGLMELVILNIGRELGVITEVVFAMMVLMALVTTFLTTPVLAWVYPERLLRAVRAKRELAPDAFGVLIPVSLPRSAKPLIRLADVITGADDTKRQIIGLHLHRAEEHDAYRAAIDEANSERKEALIALTEHAASLHVPLEPMSFVTRDPAFDIVRVAGDNQSDLILMGFHNPVIGQTFLGGTVHRVMQQAQSDVAVFIDRGLHERPKTILVPYLGSPHDKLALQMANRMGRHSGAAVTVLHIVAPGRAKPGGAEDSSGAKQATERVFADPTQPSPVTFKVVEHTDPIAAVLEEAKPFDLVVIGVAETWGLTPQLFGWRAERIARDCPSSLLIVRRSANVSDHSMAPLSTEPSLA